MLDYNITSFTNLNGLNTLSVAEFFTTVQPLFVFVVGMVIYAFFIFKFYKFVAGRDVFKIDSTASGGKKFLHILEYIFFYPIIAFFWFFVIAFILSTLSEAISIGDVFMISMATMATIRIAAYYNEELSRDIAKLVPFALLAVVLLDITKLSLETPFLVLKQIPSVANVLVYYFVFIVVVEFLLKLITYGRRNKKTPKIPTRDDLKEDEVSRLQRAIRRRRSD